MTIQELREFVEKNIDVIYMRRYSEFLGNSEIDFEIAYEFSFPNPCTLRFISFRRSKKRFGLILLEKDKRTEMLPVDDEIEDEIEWLEMLLEKETRKINKIWEENNANRSR